MHQARADIHAVPEAPASPCCQQPDTSYGESLSRKASGVWLTAHRHLNSPKAIRDETTA